MARTWPFACLVFSVLVGASACGGGGGSPAAPTPVSTTPTSPPATGTPPAAPAVAYVQDIKPILDTDCIVCHSGRNAPNGLELTTYANVLRVVQPGNANSRLIVMTQPGGQMFGNFSGDRQAKSTLIRRWVVESNAAENR